MRFVLALLLILAGVFPVLIRNNFSPSQMQTPEWIAVAVFLIIALLLIVVRRKKSDTQPEGIHSMSFSFEKLTSFLPDGSPALKQGQQLFLRPYMGEDQEQIASPMKRQKFLVLFRKNTGNMSSPALSPTASFRRW